MKYLLFAVIAVNFLSLSARAGDTLVNGYYKSNGAYVEPYHRSTPDNTVNNNYGTVGNTNPYTGTAGTRPVNYNQPQGNYNLGNGWGN